MKKTATGKKKVTAKKKTASRKKRPSLTLIPTVYNHEPHSHTILVGIPTMGKVRMEWSRALWFAPKPTSFASAMCTPTGFQVAEGRNECVRAALEGKFDWVFFLDHDVIVPDHLYFTLRKYMTENLKPVVSGLYYMKSDYRPEPLVYRNSTEPGRPKKAGPHTSGPFYDWKHGDSFWVSGIPMGCALIHTSLFRAMKPPYFHTPSVFSTFKDDNGFEAGSQLFGGTEDLHWCNRVMEEDILSKAGWKVPDPQTPFWMDTSIFCRHISLDTGLVYPDCVPDWDDNHKKALASHDRARAAEKKKKRAARQARVRRAS
jgi:hypothetical protein